MLRMSSLFSSRFPWHVRVNIPLTLLWRSRCQAQDQEGTSSSGVRRIQVETEVYAEVFDSKRSAPLDYSQADHTHTQPSQSPIDGRNRPQQPHQSQSGGPASSLHRDSGYSYDDRPSKRQRMSSDMDPRAAYEQDQRTAQPLPAQLQEPYGQSYPREQPSAIRSSYYPQAPHSASAPPADYAFGHHRNNSSSVSSPFVSPRHEYPNYPFYPANQSYQQPTRDQNYQYQQSHYAVAQPRPVPPADQPSYRPPLPSSVPSQYDQSRQYTRAYAPEDHGHGDRGYNPVYGTARPDYSSSQYYDRPSQSFPRTLPPPTQPISSILPPLPTATLPSSQPLRELQHSQSSSGGSSYEGNAQLHTGAQSGPEPRGYQGYGQPTYQQSYQSTHQPPYQGREPGR